MLGHQSNVCTPPVTSVYSVHNGWKVSTSHTNRVESVSWRNVCTYHKKTEESQHTSRNAYGHLTFFPIIEPPQERQNYSTDIAKTNLECSQHTCNQRKDNECQQKSCIHWKVSILKWHATKDNLTEVTPSKELETRLDSKVFS